MTITGTSPVTFSFYYLSAGAAGSNGIAFVSPADLDGDHITDYVYAGDLKGNVWRFDLTSTEPGQLSQRDWQPAPAFLPRSRHQRVSPDHRQKLVLASAVVSGALPSVIVSFGTGQRNQFTLTSAASYATNTTQSLYGGVFVDWNFATHLRSRLPRSTQASDEQRRPIATAW